MTGINRCYICEGRFTRGQRRAQCAECHVEFHRPCFEATESPDCPRCSGEAWIGALEF